LLRIGIRTNKQNIPSQSFPPAPWQKGLTITQTMGIRTIWILPHNSRCSSGLNDATCIFQIFSRQD
jgi:hypothetical protein